MSKSLDKLQKQLEAIKSELDNLSDFRDTPFVRKFARHLEGEKSVILEKIKQSTILTADQEKHRSERLQLANKNRSEKMKRTWRYLRSIQENFVL